MKSLKSWLLAAAVALAAPAAVAQMDIAGVKYSESTELRGTRLLLNGAGVRYKMVVKVYTAGLYLSRKSATTAEVLGAPGPKRMHIAMLRDIESAELGRLFTRGVEENMDKKGFATLVPGLMRMSQLFADIKKLNAGDSFFIDWVPGTGTVITVKGVPQGEPFKEPEFFNALMRIWLGPAPADHRLKDALLGTPAA